MKADQVVSSGGQTPLERVLEVTLTEQVMAEVPKVGSAPWGGREPLQGGTV